MRLITVFACLLLVCMPVLPSQSQVRSIYSMVVDDQILELADVIPLTENDDGRIMDAWVSPDGKQVAYVSQLKGEVSLKRLAVTNVSGGRSRTTFDNWQYLSLARTKDYTPALGDEFWVLSPDEETIPVAWSPDSNLLAFPVTRLYMEEEPHQNVWLLVVTPTGTRRAAFQMSESAGEINAIHWNRDGRRLAVSTYEGFLVLDIFTRNVQQINPSDGWFIALVGWSVPGNAIVYTVQTEEGVQTRQVNVDGSNDILIGQQQDDRHIPSPDGVLRFVRSEDADGSGFIEDMSTGQRTSVEGFAGWSPDGKLFCYRKSVVLEEHSNSPGVLNMLWLGAFREDRISSFCVAHNSDPDTNPAWASDSSSLVYVHRGRLYSARLDHREPATAEERLSLGLPLTEEQEIPILMSNAKQIALGIIMYASDWDDAYPDEANFYEGILPYLRNDQILYRPGTDDIAFRYTSPAERDNQVQNPTTTEIGYFDVGYNWRIVAFADGHVARVPKDK